MGERACVRGWGGYACVCVWFVAPACSPIAMAARTPTTIPTITPMLAPVLESTTTAELVEV